MFKPGEKIVCIKNIKHKTNLTIGKTYIAVGAQSDIHIWVRGNNHNMMDICLCTYFVTELESRRKKLLKIKERICLKSVIE